jgi:glutamate 5-kinase
MSGHHRIVVKLGTQVVVNATSGTPALDRISAILLDIKNLLSAGHEIILVSSGAIGMGRQALHLTGPLSLAQRQACASVGQVRMMSLYDQMCIALGITTAQILVTSNNFADRAAYLNLGNTCEALLSLGTLPIFNENDVVSTAGIKERGDLPASFEQRSFDDNDKLSALIAGKLAADILVILTGVDGVYSDNPETNPLAERISLISSLPQLNSVACSGTSSLGRGGMSSKLEAAKIAALCGVKTIITSACKSEPVTAVLSGGAGTTIDLRPTDTPLLRGKRRWFGTASGFTGIITVDNQARKILELGGASLLPVGVVKVEGEFEIGDVVSIVDQSGVEIGRGIASQMASTLRQVAGLRSADARPLLTIHDKEEAIHRDNLAIFTEASDVA